MVSSSSVDPSSHRDVRRPLANPRCIYYGEDDESFKKEIKLISSNFETLLLLDRDCTRSMVTQDLVDSTIDNYLKVGARMNLACVQLGREITHLEKFREENSSDKARLLGVERIEKEKLKSELAEVQRISYETSGRLKNTLMKLRELKAKTRDKDELVTMFKTINEGVDQEVYIFNLGVKGALDKVTERFPYLDLKFVRECFDLSYIDDDVDIKIEDDSS